MPGNFLSSAQTDGDIRRWTFVIAAFALAMQIVLIWSVNFPPLHDAPNHMARHWLEAQYLFGGETSPFYGVDYKILPNLGGDLVVPPLMALFSPVVAYKIFLSLAVSLYWLGPALFIWQYGNYSPASLAASLLLLPLNMSSGFLWGFLNYYTGVGLAFLVLVHFTATSRKEPPGFLDLALHTALVSLLFFWHLSAVVIYGVVMASQNAIRLWQGWSAGTFKASFTRAVLLSLPMLPSIVFYGAYATIRSPAANYWGTWWHKLTMPLYVFRTYSFTADAIVAVLWILAGLAFFGLVWRGQQKPWLWLAIFLFALLAVVIPLGWGSVFNADVRVLPPLLVCVLAVAARSRLRHFLLGAAILTVATAIRYGSVYAAWTALDTRLTEISAGFEKIPAGSRVMAVSGTLAGLTLAKELPENTFASWAVPLRGAFVTGLFAYRDQQPLVVKQSDKIYARLEGNEIVVDDAPTRADYDFVWLFNPHRKPVRISSGFKKIFETQDVTIWRVMR